MNDDDFKFGPLNDFKISSSETLAALQSSRIPSSPKTGDAVAFDFIYFNESGTFSSTYCWEHPVKITIGCNQVREGCYYSTFTSDALY